MNERIVRRIRKRIEFLKKTGLFPGQADPEFFKNEGAIEELELLLVFLIGARSRSQVRRMTFQERAV